MSNVSVVGVNTEISSTSTLDDEREAERWQRKNENILYEWLGEWKSAAESHAQCYESYSMWQNVVAVPSVVLPLVCTPLSFINHRDCSSIESTVYMSSNVMGFVVCACIAALNAYCGWGIIAEKHLISSKRYHDLVSDVEEILSKHKKDRDRAAVVLRTLKLKSAHLLEEAPCLSRAQRDEVRRAGRLASNVKCV